MKFRLTVDMDNAAFEARPGRELRRILDHIGARLMDGEMGGKAMDVNGNSVGTWEITK